MKDEAEALAIANETQFGLGAGVWTRDTNLAYRMGRGIKAGRVWTNCYHVYPAHAAFGGYVNSPASGGKRTRWRWMPISKPKTCW
ncbi:aldehyde dehydrogenase family protein [Klebsiella pneumoniae subsp. pneumoniae]|nr:aldehyde dehydrogenase family protein [Klebsiella pneumoniae subsp. pneumoniae]